MKTIRYSGTDELIYYERISNGLEVYMYPKETAKNFYITYNTRYGSINTDYKVNNKVYHNPQGTAHFLEHQMFQDTDGPIFPQFASLGSSVNAYTTYDLTCYEVVSSTHFKENLELLLHCVETPVFKSSSIENEKGIIKEEIKMYDNIPDAVLNYGLEYNLNVKDKHKYLISGNIEDIKKINKDILYDAYNAFYHPSNMFIVISGNFKPLEALGIIKEIESKRDTSEPKKITKIKVKEPLTVYKSYEEKNMDVSISKVRISYKLPKKIFKNYSDLEIKLYLKAILQLKFGSTSDLLEKLNNENLLMWDIDVSKNMRNDYILISFSFETEYIKEVKDLIKNELNNISITKEELNRFIRVNISNFILHFNNIIDVCEDIQDDVLNNGRIVNDILNIYKNLDIKSINDIASKIDLTNECIFIINKGTNNN